MKLQDQIQAKKKRVEELRRIRAALDTSKSDIGDFPDLAGSSESIPQDLADDVESLLGNTQVTVEAVDVVGGATATKSDGPSTPSRERTHSNRRLPSAGDVGVQQDNAALMVTPAGRDRARSIRTDSTGTTASATTSAAAAGAAGAAAPARTSAIAPRRSKAPVLFSLSAFLR
eukprot:m.203036 g.203036  ORF g.203036 m.203036 type:complete len:173 (-) comp17731_c0_seq7:1432-1950(-)